MCETGNDMSGQPGPPTSAAATAGLLRRMNERRVIDALADGPCSRADVTRRTGLSAPTVSKAIVSLGELGLVEHSDIHENTAGRPAFVYSLAADAVHVVGVTVAPDRCGARSCGVDCRSESDAADTWVTPPDADAIVGSIAERIVAFDSATEKRLLGVGITVPGAVDPNTGAILHCPTIPALQGVDLAEQLAQRTGTKVRVVAQATGLCLAEQWFAESRERMQFVIVDLNDDLALRCCMARQTMASPDGRCGELGRIPTAPDSSGTIDTDQHIGDIASDAAFAAAVSGAVGRAVDPAEAAKLVADGDQPELAAIVDGVVRQLAHATVIVARIISPQAILFHGRLLDADDGILRRIADRAAAFGNVPTMQRASAGLDQAAVAAIVDLLAADE